MTDEAPGPALDGYAEVAIPVPLRRAFTYAIPDALLEHIKPGSRVAVPFHRRKVAGIVVSTKPTPPEGIRVKKIAGVIERDPLFPEELLRFLEAAAGYYFHPIGEVLKSAAPALPTGALRRLRKDGFLDDGETLKGQTVGTKLALFAKRTDLASEGLRLGASQRSILALLEAREEVGLDELREHAKSPRGKLARLAELGLVSLTEREVRRDPFFSRTVEPQGPLEPTGAQQVAIDAMIAELGSRAAFLLHGVTGSGKTEVYLQVIAEAHRRGLGSLLLVPEIALTPQLVGRFRARFGDGIAVLHSALSPRERDDAWRGLRSGELRFAVGARSALFAPIDKLGVIVVDEEHDPSFKQEEGFRYHARDMALLRAHRANALCILGSATPSLESYALQRRGRATLLSMPERATKRSLPKVEIVDLRRHVRGPTGHRFVSGPLHHALRDGLEEKQQAILFLNRRGFVPSRRCESCGELLSCPACSVTLTEHRRASQLRCHYCDYRCDVPSACPACGADGLKELGLGTEQLEDHLNGAFPDARIARLDRDTARGRGIEDVLHRFREGEIDVLVGTQMVTKGHDVKAVTTVGVVSADQSLAFPDFRAEERTFQLLAQVAGRAGRGEREGRVFFQTFQPDHRAVRCAARHDYQAFVEQELEARRDLLYPPFAHLVAVRVDSGSEPHGRRVIGDLARVARAALGEREGSVLGPVVAPIARLRGRYRFRMMLRAPQRAVVREVAAAVIARIEEGVGNARASIDVDPVSML